jgi:large subunit ribosomal protein L22
MEVFATAKQVRMSARKVRLVTDLVRGKRVSDALNELRMLRRAAALPVFKVVKSAAANAENNFNMSPEDLYIVKIMANEGPTLKRFKPRSRGRSGQILKRTTHITAVVDEKEG